MIAVEYIGIKMERYAEISMFLWVVVRCFDWCRIGERSKKNTADMMQYLIVDYSTALRPGKYTSKQYQK